MQIAYAFESTEGPVRQNNEDSTAVWLPDTTAEQRRRGSLMVLADGMGGQARGEVASRIACEVAMKTFLNAEPEVAAAQLLQDLISAANLAIYNDNQHDQHNPKSQKHGAMATTMTACLFRHNELTIGHVGDCRVYLLQQNRIRRLTVDHSYAGVQLKLGLITAQSAASSELRSVLTRSVGNELFVRPDIVTVRLHPLDVVIACCDGVWSKVTEGELFSIASKNSPENGCRELIQLAEKRFADDNLTVQIALVLSVERRNYYRGLPTYQKEEPTKMGNDLEVGQLLDDRYQITEVISRSGMAMIFKAHDKNTDRDVALKVPLMRYESDPGFFNRFQREQQIGWSLDHPYVLHLLDTPEQNKSRPYLVMEFLEGQTLGRLMQVLSPMPVHDALKIASRICEALHYLHEHKIVHRDLKPDNIMICGDGSIRIMDFGIAKFEGQRRLTFGGLTPAMGTPDYMAPEQVRGKRGDARTDLYSLGAILYEMVTGQTPFQGENPFIIMNSRISGDPTAPREVNEAISPQVEEIVLHAMARLPQDRYPDALSMKRELDDPDSVQVTGRAERLVRPSMVQVGWRRSRLVIICVAIPVIIVLGVLLSKHVQFK